MGKLQFCRICRTDKNLKYTAKELRQFNKNQLQLAQATQEGHGTDRASKKLLLTTRTSGNICLVCDQRVQIFHHLDDADHDSGSDIEIDVVDATNSTLPSRLVNTLPNGGPLQRTRPDTPVIVDDDDMLYNLFMQKVDQQRQLKTQSQQQTHVQQTLIPQQPPQYQLQPQQQFVTQFPSSYTPPQSMAGGSEGDESKVVEVLTSRESTPASSIKTQGMLPTADIIDQQGHRIVAIIDLDDDDDVVKTAEKDSGLLTPLTNSSNDLSLIEAAAEERPGGLLTPIKNYGQSNEDSASTTKDNVMPEYEDDDDEEIIFRKVEPTQTPPSSSKKRKRKSYDEKQLRLVASLNLVSSDSENEDSPTKPANKKSLNSDSPSKESVNLQKSSSKCNQCNIYFPDAESLSVHERIHQGMKCPVCQFGFQQAQRLIHHMRYKHREYNGEVLYEKPRVAQDSCMTIRLRYMERTTFFECQLCGRIDEIFREHKEHIIDKHPNESKSLKDPMMKQLKCPVCKVKCGAQYLSLCRHLITNHEHQEYKGHLRELLHVSAFGWNAARQQEVEKTARIYQFIKRKTFFFECKICRKVVAGYLHHLRHLKQHETPTKQKTKVSTSSTSKVKHIPSSTNSSSSTTTKSSATIVLKEIPKKLEKAKKLKMKENAKMTTKKSQRLKKPLKLEKSLKSENSDPQTKIKQLKNKSSESKTRLPRKPTESVEKLKIKIKIKPKGKEKLPATTPKATKGRPRKNKDILQKSQIKKVKVKPPIRQIDLQKYKCKYCLNKFKGFRLFNLHLLTKHNENEYNPCKKCTKIFSLPSSLQEHTKQCHYADSSPPKRKRKFVENSLKLDESCNKIIKIEDRSTAQQVPNDIGNSKHSSSNILEDDQQQWLKDLLKLHASSKTTDSSSSTSSSSSLHLTKTNTALFIPQNINLPCCYCLHLFACKDDLDLHTKQQHSQKPEILIKYKTLKC